MESFQETFFWKSFSRALIRKLLIIVYCNIKAIVNKFKLNAEFE